MRQDVFDSLVAFKEQKEGSLPPEAERALDLMIIKGKRNGMDKLLYLSKMYSGILNSILCGEIISLSVIKPFSFKV
jgi:hypothetical protein